MMDTSGMTATDRLSAAVMAHRSGDLAEAERVYVGILQEDPEQPDALHFLGLIRHQNRHHEDAVALLRRSIEVFPGNAGVHNNLGNIYKKLGAYQDAFAAYQEALKRDPGLATAWCNLGVLMRINEQLDTSIAMLEQAVELDPKSGEAWHNLGTSCMVAQKLERAAEAFERCINHVDEGWSSPIWHARILCALDRRNAAIEMLEAFIAARPDNVLAPYQLQAIRGDAIDKAPEDYVREQFDNFAQSFDSVLAGLDYRAPELVGAKVRSLIPDGAGLDVVDLGCGTGLVGPLIKPVCGQLVGVDLSPKMLAGAHARGLYDYLVECELVRFLKDADAGSFDLAVCVDTLVYLGAMEEVFAGLAHALKPSGLAIVSTERLDPDHPQADGFILTESGRYAHGDGYIRRVAEAAGLTMRDADPVVLRQELGAPVNGTVHVLQRQT